jgi:ribosomal protein L7/L12
MPKCRFCDHINPTGVDRCQSCGAWLEQSVSASPQQPAEPATSNDDFEAQIVSLARQGQLITAVKLYRERTGSGLAEAKAAVEALAAGAPIERKNAEVGPIQPDTLEGHVIALMQARKKIEAVRVYRQQTGVGLKEAKDAVEELAVKHRISPKGAGCAGMVLLMIAIGSMFILST